MSPAGAGIAWAFICAIPACLVIRFLASGGTMRRTSPKVIDAVIARRAALHARRVAARAFGDERTKP